MADWAQTAPLSEACTAVKFYCHSLKAPLLPPALLLPYFPGPFLPGCWALDPGHAVHCIPSHICIRCLYYVAKEVLIWKLGGMGTPSPVRPDHPPLNSPTDSPGPVTGRGHWRSSVLALPLPNAEPSRNLLQKIRDVVCQVPAGRRVGERSKA